MVFVLRGDSDVPTRRLAVDRIRANRVAAVVGLAVALLMVVGGVMIGRGLQRSSAVANENLQLTRRIEGLDLRVEQAESLLGRVQVHDAKIRSLTRADEGVRPYGIGPLEDLEILALRDADSGATLPNGRPARESAVSLEERVDRLAESLVAEEISLQEVRGYLVTREALLDAYPTDWPADGWLTSRYGFRRSPLPGSNPFHVGIDIAAAYGSPIRAAADGVVTDARFRDAYGYTIEIDHGFGIGTLYAHCSRLLADVGDEVERGDVIAHMGRTGRSTGPHLHYEISRDGVPVNPETFLVGDLVKPTLP